MSSRTLAASPRFMRQVVCGLACTLAPGCWNQTQAEAPVQASSVLTRTSVEAGQARGRRAEQARGAQAEPNTALSQGVICDREIDSFEAGPVGGFPAGWELRHEEQKPLVEEHGAYRVVEAETGRALEARYVGAPVTIGRGVDAWNLERYPILEWEWKVLSLPRSAATSEADAAAEVGVIWLVGPPFMVRGIDYAYSAARPSGSRSSRLFGQLQTVVLESGQQNLGRWRKARVDVFGHYRRFFDADESKPPTGIALTTAAEDARVLYRRFRLCRFEPPPPTRAP